MTAGVGGGVSGDDQPFDLGDKWHRFWPFYHSINVVWDSGVSPAPDGFTAGVLQAAHSILSTALPITSPRTSMSGLASYALNGARGMSLMYLPSCSYTQTKSALAG